jgi:flagellar basal body-associated protein FliL
MSPRLDHRPSRSLWIALALATALFLLAIVLSFARMASTDPVLQRTNVAMGAAPVAGSP